MVTVAAGAPAGASPSWPGSSAVCAQRRLGGTTLRGEGRACRPPVLAIATLTTRDGATRYAAVILLIGLCGVAAGTAVQLRHVLTHPVVADDEGTLKADFLMRVEDAREVALPTVVWSLPVVSVFDTGLDPWNTGWLVFIVLSVIALALITISAGRRALAAQQGPNAQ